MSVQPSLPSDTGAIVLFVIFISAVCVRYWKQTLVAFAVGIVVLSILGMLDILHAVLRLLA